MKIKVVMRIIRSSPGKQAVIINLYTPNTQEVSWLKKKQEGQNNIKWITSLSQI